MFTLRVLHGNAVFMLGPAANHYVTVSHASNFTWRDSYLRELTALLGDGLLTIDGDFHRSSRQLMLPAFHRDQLAATVSGVVAEIEASLQRWTVGAQIDLYAWTRRLSLRVAMRALFGLDPDGTRARWFDAAELFERALSFYGQIHVMKMLGRPRYPWRRMRQAARELDSLIYAEIGDRRRRQRGGEAPDGNLLDLLIEARDDSGNALSDRQIRDEVMTLMFAGHDTTISTIALIFYRAGAPSTDRRPSAGRAGRAARRREAHGRPADVRRAGRAGDGHRRDAAHVSARVDRATTVGARRSSSKARRSPRTRSCSTARGHRTICRTIFPEPERLPTRALYGAGARGAAKGGLRSLRRRLAHVHWDALRPARGARDRHAHPLRFTLSVADNYRLDITPMPTISPKHGLPVTVAARSRSTLASLQAAA